MRVVGGVLSTLTYAFLSVCAAAHKTWPILYAHSPNKFLSTKKYEALKGIINPFPVNLQKIHAELNGTPVHRRVPVQGGFFANSQGKG